VNNFSVDRIRAHIVLCTGFTLLDAMLIGRVQGHLRSGSINPIKRYIQVEEELSRELNPSEIECRLTLAEAINPT